MCLLQRRERHISTLLVHLLGHKQCGRCDGFYGAMEGLEGLSQVLGELHRSLQRFNGHCKPFWSLESFLRAPRLFVALFSLQGIFRTLRLMLALHQQLRCAMNAWSQSDHSSLLAMDASVMIAPLATTWESISIIAPRSQ